MSEGRKLESVRPLPVQGNNPPCTLRLEFGAKENTPLNRLRSESRMYKRIPGMGRLVTIPGVSGELCGQLPAPACRLFRLSVCFCSGHQHAHHLIRFFDYAVPSLTFDLSSFCFEESLSSQTRGRSPRPATGSQWQFQ